MNPTRPPLYLLEEIAEMMDKGLTMTEIAAKLGRTRNSIAGLVYRNRDRIDFYTPNSEPSTMHLFLRIAARRGRATQRRMRLSLLNHSK